MKGPGKSRAFSVAAAPRGWPCSLHGGQCLPPYRGVSLGPGVRHLLYPSSFNPVPLQGIARPQERGIRGIPLSTGNNAGLRKTASFCPDTPSLHLTPPQRTQARCTSGRKRTLRARWPLFRPLPAPTPPLLSAAERPPRGMWCILRSPLLCSQLFSPIIGRAHVPVSLLMVKRHLLFSIRKSPMPVARPGHEASANPQKKDASATYGRRRAGRGFPESVRATPLPAG